MAQLTLSPNSRIFLEGAEHKSLHELAEAFKTSSGYGLLHLDVLDDPLTNEPSFIYWKEFARLFLSSFAATPGLDQRDLRVSPLDIELAEEDLNRLLLAVPPMKGAEYVNEDALRSLWRDIATALHSSLITSGQGIIKYFARKHPGLSLLGKVCFHLAENKSSRDLPFAFLATYAHRVTKDGKTQHSPLKRALEEFKGVEQKSALLRLLSPLQKASKQSELINDLVRSGDIYETLAWEPRTAHRFLKDLPIFEVSGVAVRVPDWWRPKQPNRPRISVRLGDEKPSALGFDALVDFNMSVVLNDRELSEKDIQALLASSDSLVFFKGQWVEVDRGKLGDLLTKWKTAAASMGDGVSFGDAIRLLSGLDHPGGEEDATNEPHTATRVVSGEWLTQVLEGIRNPETDRKTEKILGSHLRAELRPYQKKGIAWLDRLNRLRLGGILADDMGLGKTLQIIALLVLRQQTLSDEFKCLLVVPASLIGNWKAELAKFAPSLRVWIAHPSGNGYGKPDRDRFDILITTYGSLVRAVPWVAGAPWSLVVADEAQAIKNPGAKQTKAIKSVPSQHRLALTGTPVENQLMDLWSLFDFVSPGLLGSTKEFEAFLKRTRKGDSSSTVALRKLTRPYILRRLKTDKTVIQDLPDKTEIKTYCQLSKSQAALYQKSVDSLAREIAEVEGIKRRGVILSYLMRFKQICNHPSQLVKNDRFLESDSGKFQRLREICEVVAGKQERALIFTQFKEMTGPLDDFLAGVFGRQGLVLHGATLAKQRTEMVARFQQEDGPPYFVLSIKAGGTGLNLTSASHVVHFDRWWNPAVENQATDRAFRIGQRRNVLVHKFICKGTLEEKIDSLIESKQSISKELLEEGEATLLTELGNAELLEIVALDMKSAVFDQ